ncbi:MAG: hypothetical protein IPK52_18425 [Chloroflexi bacterium]|nr:hypothetical protein [Chloroflexota bacterium]
MMTPLTLTLPQDITEQAQAIADLTERPVEEVVIEYLRTLRAPDSTLPHDIRSELDALQYLSDDALWVIAREQLASAAQKRADELLGERDPDRMGRELQEELSAILDRADRIMLRKAEAAVLLKRRGYEVTPDLL